jgi:hypothetical protein
MHYGFAAVWSATGPVGALQTSTITHAQQCNSIVVHCGDSHGWRAGMLGHAGCLSIEYQSLAVVVG